MLSDVALASVELENGAILKQDSELWTPGEIAYVQDSEGHVSVAPEGSHKAVDGQTYHIDAEGKLVNWTTTPAEVISVDEPKPMDEEMMAKKKKSYMSEDGKMVEVEINEGSEYSYDEMVGRLDSISAAIGELMNRVSALETASAEMVAPVTEELKKMKTKMEEIESSPAAVSLSAINTSTEANLTPEEIRANRFTIMAKHLKAK